MNSVFEHGGGQVRGEHKYLYELLRRLKATRVSEAEGFAKIVYVWPNVHPAFIDVHNTLPYCCRVGLVQPCILYACLVLDTGLGRVWDKVELYLRVFDRYESKSIPYRHI